MVDKQKQAEYQKKYETKRVSKRVSFNTETEKDLLEIANNLDFSQWVKEMIKEKFRNNLTK